MLSEKLALKGGEKTMLAGSLFLFLRMANTNLDLSADGKRSRR